MAIQKLMLILVNDELISTIAVVWLLCLNIFKFLFNFMVSAMKGQLKKNCLYICLLFEQFWYLFGRIEYLFGRIRYCAEEWDTCSDEIETCLDELGLHLDEIDNHSDEIAICLDNLVICLNELDTKKRNQVSLFS